MRKSKRPNKAVEHYAASAARFAAAPRYIGVIVRSLESPGLASASNSHAEARRKIVIFNLSAAPRLRVSVNGLDSGQVDAALPVAET